MDDAVLIPVKEAARRLGVAPWTIYQLCDAGALRCRYIGRRRLIEPDSLTEYAAGLPTERPDSA